MVKAKGIRKDIQAQMSEFVKESKVQSMSCIIKELVWTKELAVKQFRNSKV